MTSGQKSSAFLSKRETEVLQMLAQGFTNQQVADALSLSVKTAETYRVRLTRKLGVKSRAELFRSMESEFASGHTSEPFDSHRTAKERAWKLLRAKGAFDLMGPSAASDDATNAAKDLRTNRGIIAPPLLGERAGVRAVNLPN